MFKEYIYNNSPAQFHNRIRIIDSNSIFSTVDYTAEFSKHGFDIICYSDDITFRLEYEDKIKHDNQKYLLITKSGDYLPYDFQIIFSNYELSYEKLFPRLNSEVLMSNTICNYELFVYAYEKSYENMQSESESKDFLINGMFHYAAEYLEKENENLLSLAKAANSYKDWFAISKKKAKAEVLAAECDCNFDSTLIDGIFKDYVMNSFGKLSGISDSKSPILVSRAMEYIHDSASKFAIIVMDGMSAFDWEIFSAEFRDIVYEYSNAFAMIPTTTSISRQCLLSNKFPQQLEDPWHQDKEKNEFVNCARDMGFLESQISYERGYDINFDLATCCGAIIINDVDDMVHRQKQGRKGMLQGIRLLSHEAKLSRLVNQLIANDFDVYITSDHGNTVSMGLGLLKGIGVLVETKSRKMLVLKDFADKDKWKNKYGMLEYPKYYLPKEFDYLICDTGTSMDVDGETVMTHGGVSIDEVIVPFIKIKAEDNK